MAQPFFHNMSEIALMTGVLPKDASLDSLAIQAAQPS
jgi:hypothetical protein